MTIKIPTTERKYFRQVLEIIKPIPPLNTLRNKELDVLAEILYYNHKYKDLDKAVRGKIVFDYSTKVEMRDYLGMDEQSFNNNLTSLRKKGVLTRREIDNDFGINDLPDVTFKFIFK